MKQFTCEQLGGLCDYMVEAEGPEELMGAHYAHVAVDHPDIKEGIDEMSDEAKALWEQELMKTWDSEVEFEQR